MKRLFIILVITSCFSLFGCMTSSKYVINTSCDKTQSELFAGISRLMVVEGYVLDASDPYGGYVRYVRNDGVKSLFVSQLLYVWEFNINPNGQIYATCRTESTEEKSVDIMYIGDSTYEGNLWYWNVRYGLEEVCGRRIEVIQTNESQYIKRERKY